MNLTPPSPKPLPPANATAKSHIKPIPSRKRFPQPRRRATRIPNSLEAGQRNFILDQHSKDKERRTKDELAMRTSKERAIKEPTSELIKRIKSKPRGLMAKYRLRRKAGYPRKQAEKSKLGLSQNADLLVEKEELMVVSKGGLSLDKKRARSA